MSADASSFTDLSMSIYSIGIIIIGLNAICYGAVVSVFVVIFVCLFIFLPPHTAR